MSVFLYIFVPTIYESQLDCKQITENHMRRFFLITMMCTAVVCASAKSNVFVKPDGQSQTCLSSAMARTNGRRPQGKAKGRMQSNVFVKLKW